MWQPARHYLPVVWARYSHSHRPTSYLQETYDQVDRFIQQFHRDVLSKDKFDISFARSSGPGGQNVNKVNTKVEIRFHVLNAEWLPMYIRQKLMQQNANRMNKKGEIAVTSDRHRTQHANLQDCVDKLYEAIVEAGQVPKGPSEETMDKIKLHQSTDKERRKNEKQRNASKKSERRRDVF